MQLDDIQAFVAVADARSLSRAARELHLTQPAVTRRLQRLEAALGVVLCDRRRRPFSLTEAGQAVLERCRRVLRGVQDVQTAAAHDGLPISDVRVGVAHALTEVTLTDPVDRVQRAFPKVALRLSTGWSRDLLAQVRTGSLEAAVIFLAEGERLPSGIEGTRVGRERLVVVGPRRGWPPRVSRITDLDNVTWVLNPEGCAARAGLLRALLRANVNMHVAVETYTYELQLSLVARHRGLSLVPARILARSRLRSRLGVRRVRGLDFPLTIWMVWAPGAPGLDTVLTALNCELT
jgi:DNA-binding transcriptional LysR family regulator